MQTVEDPSKAPIAPPSKYKAGSTVNVPQGTKDGSYTLQSGVKIKVLNGVGTVVE